MSAWLLAAILCVPASAQVFEAGGAAAPAAPVPGAVGASMGAGASVSPIATVPGAALLAPSLNSAVLAAFPGQAASNLPAGAVRLAPAPLPALPASAAASAAPAPTSEGSPSATQAPSRRDVVPPSGALSASSPRAVAADRRRGSEEGSASAAAASRVDAEGRAAAAPGDAAVRLDLLSAESSAELGRKLFDRVEDRPALTEGAPGGAPGQLIAEGPVPARDPLLAPSDAADAGADGLRDAVASPVPAAAAAAPGASLSFFHLPSALFAPSRAASPSGASAALAPRAAAPVSFERLSLELGSGLVVKVRAALGFPSTAAPLVAPAPNGAAALSARRAASRAPVTSTEWLERRGLLESLSASEAAAVQRAGASGADAPLFVARGLAPSVAPHSSAAPARASFAPAPAAPARVPAPVWWALAFLPAGLVLLKELL